MLSHAQHPSVVGVGYRQPHYAQLISERPALAFLEVHSENFFAPGGAARQVLRNAREHYPVSLHGVGLALGSAVGIDARHLDSLAKLASDIEPIRISDHLCFARAALTTEDVIHGSDLLPPAFTRQSLEIFSSNIDRVQHRLQRPILIENISSYVRWTDSTYTEPEFLNLLCKRTGCRLLVDVNNVVVNALNDARTCASPVSATCRWLDAIAPEHVAEMHLAGYCEAGSWVIDDHGSRVHAPVWAAYEHAVQCFGAIPTCIEWDTNVPPLATLLDEAGLAAAIVRDTLERAGEGEHA